MKITFLGSGGAFADYRVNYHNNALVETSEGPVLIDCGYTACQSLKELGLHPCSLRAVLFTHLHSDHASPEQLIWERYYSGPHGHPAFQKTRLVAPGELLGPMKRSLEAYINIFSDAHGEVRDDGIDALVDFDIQQEVEIGDTRFRYFRVPHVSGARIEKDAFGIEIIQGERRVFWSGDTTFSPDWVLRAADNPEVVQIFHECTFLPKTPGTVHTHWSELLSLPEETLRRITLMHHTQVPTGVDVSMVNDAARRHQVFDLK